MKASASQSKALPSGLSRSKNELLSVSRLIASRSNQLKESNKRLTKLLCRDTITAPKVPENYQAFSVRLTEFKTKISQKFPLRLAFLMSEGDSVPDSGKSRQVLPVRSFPTPRSLVAEKARKALKPLNKPAPYKAKEVISGNNFLKSNISGMFRKARAGASGLIPRSKVALGGVERASLPAFHRKGVLGSTQKASISSGKTDIPIN